MSEQFGKESGRDYNKFGVFLAFIVLKATREDEITRDCEKRKGATSEHWSTSKRSGRRGRTRKGDWERTTSELGKPGEYDALEVHQMESM